MEPMKAKEALAKLASESIELGGWQTAARLKIDTLAPKATRTYQRLQKRARRELQHAETFETRAFWSVLISNIQRVLDIREGRAGK